MSSYEETRVGVLIEASTRDHAELAAVTEKLETAKRTFGAKRARIDEVAVVYANQPTKENETLLLSARDASDLAEIAVIAATRDVERRQQAVRHTDAALADARATLDARKIADENAELHLGSSPEHVAVETAKLWEAMLLAESMKVDAARALDEVYRGANLKAAKLRERGEVSSPLGPHHLLRGFVEHALQERPELAGKFLALLDPRGTLDGGLVHQIAGGLAPLVRDPLLDRLRSAESAAQPPEHATEKLRAFFAARTIGDAMAAADAVGAKAEPENRAPVSNGPLPRFSRDPWFPPANEAAGQ